MRGYGRPKMEQVESQRPLKEIYQKKCILGNGSEATYESVQNCWNRDPKKTKRGCVKMVYPLRELAGGIFLGTTLERIRTLSICHLRVRQKMFAGKMVIRNIQRGDPTPWGDQPHFEHAKMQASRWTSRWKGDHKSSSSSWDRNWWKHKTWREK